MISKEENKDSANKMILKHTLFTDRAAVNHVIKNKKTVPHSIHQFVLTQSCFVYITLLTTSRMKFKYLKNAQVYVYFQKR